MKLRQFIKSDLFFVSIILLIAIINIFIRANFPDLIQGDTESYIMATRLIGGESVEEIPYHRILKPLAPATVLMISKLTHISIFNAMLVQAIIFYLALAVAIYYLLKLFFKDRFLSFVGAVLYISAYPMLKSGISMLTETGAWFFYVIALIFVFLYYLKPAKKYFIGAVLLIVIGFLWKEYSVLAAALLFFAIVFHPKLTKKDKAITIAQYALLGLLLFLPWQIIVYYKFNYTYFSWYTSPARYTLSEILFYGSKSLFAVFLLGWILVIIGTKQWPKLNPEQRFILKGLLSVSLMMFLWGSMDSRLYYVIAVPLTILATMGLKHLMHHWRYCFVIILYLVIILGNYIWLGLGSNLRSMLGQFSS